MTLKGLACLTVALSGCLIGVEYRGRLMTRVRTLTMFSEMFAEIRAGIAYGGTALNELIRDLAGRGTGGPFLLRLRDAMDGQSFSHAWQTAMTGFEKQMCLSSEDVNLLGDCAALLGHSDVEGELRALDGIAERLSQAVSQAKEKLCVEGRIRITVGCACGIVLALLLL